MLLITEKLIFIVFFFLYLFSCWALLMLCGGFCFHDVCLVLNFTAEQCSDSKVSLILLTVDPLRVKNSVVDKTAHFHVINKQRKSTFFLPFIVCKLCSLQN